MTSTDGFLKVGPVDVGYSRNPTGFDLKGCNEISQIFISAAEDGIKSILFQYVGNGKYVLSGKYGYANSANKFHTNPPPQIELNHPAEYIIGVNGLYSRDYGNIKAITFTTNIQVYGPFGTNPNLQSQSSNMKSFTYSLGKSFQFGGFHGAFNSEGLVSIGLYLRVKTELPKPCLKDSKELPRRDNCSLS